MNRNLTNMIFRYLCFCIFFISIFSVNIFCQSNLFENHFVNHFVNPELSSLELYKSVNTFNERNNKYDFLLKNNFTHRLDSSIDVFYSDPNSYISKSEYIYEEDKDVFLGWDLDNDSGIWLPRSYNVFHYKNGIITSQSHNIWDGDLDNVNELSPQLTRTFCYNSDNQIVAVKIQNRAAINEMRNSNYLVFDYTKHLLLERSADSIWSVSLKKMILGQQTFFSHDSLDQLEYSVRNRYFDDGELKTSDSIYISYNTNGQVETEMTYLKISADSEYSPSTQYKYFYNEDGSIKEVWDVFRDWFSQFKVIRYTYHPYGSLKETKTFEGRIQNQDTIYNQTVGYGRLLYRHAGHIPSSQVQYPRTRFSNSFFDISHYYENHMLIADGVLVGGSFIEPETIASSTDYYYTELNPLSTNGPVVDHTIKVYPNPASNFIQFESDTKIAGSLFQLFDDTGSLVHSSEVTENENIDTSSLSSGIYFYKIETNGKIEAGKIVIDKSL